MMKACVRLEQGDVFNGPCDLVVLPCSTGGGVTDFVLGYLEKFNVPSPRPTIQLGEIDVNPFSAKEHSAQFLAFAASVNNMSSSPEAIEQIGEHLGQFTVSVSSVRNIYSPLLGTGAGGLSDEVVVDRLRKGFQLKAHPESTLIIKVLHQEEFEQLVKHFNSQDGLIAKYVNTQDKLIVKKLDDSIEGELQEISLDTRIEIPYSSNKIRIAGELRRTQRYTLRQLSLSQNIYATEEILEKFGRHYAIDDDGNIIGLWLINAQLSEVKFLEELEHLKWLALSHNHISDVSFLGKLPNLLAIDLSHNQISDISSLGRLSLLAVANISNNRISRIPGLPTLPHLTKLDLSYNHISDVSENLNLTNLEELNVKGNRIVNTSSFEKLSCLTRLNLSENQLSDIYDLRKWSNLTHLYLRNNQISDIEPLQDLQKLFYVNLRGNIIDQLPDAFIDSEMPVRWDGYSGIVIAENPLPSPPIEIVDQGREALKTYFKSLVGNRKAVNEVKVLLVGDGGAGKTSVVNQLFGKAFDKHESQTRGIQISTKEFNVDDITIKVHFWDFGGQEIMHATHQFFLSKRSLYILVLDSRKDEKTEYWLKHIESFGGDSPVIIVLNKIDEHPGFDLNRRELRRKYPNIRGFYQISCATNEGIPLFVEALRKALLNIELLQTSWPTNWFHVKDRVENLCNHFISYEEYTDICCQENITTRSKQETLLEFLHDLGVILNFKELELEDTYVLDPNWVTEAVYRIINSDTLARKRGVLQLRSMSQILQQRDEMTSYKYPRSKYNYIIELMKKFEICYKIGKNTILVPDLLDIQEPLFDFEYENALKFIFDYEFLPPSVMPRFIVKMHYDIKDKQQWRTGVLLADKALKSEAVVKADNDAQKISIFVNGEQRRDYFAVIRKTLRDINNSFEKLTVAEFVPIPNHEEILVEYDKLVLLEHKKREDIFIWELDEDYKVKQLLNGIEKEEVRSGEKKGEQVNNVFHFHETANVTIDHSKQEVNDMSSKTNVQFGDGATTHGDFVVANKIQDSFNKADSSD